MCNEFALPPYDRTFEGDYGVKLKESLAGGTHAFPSSPVMIVRETAEGRIAEVRRWGLIPFWVKPDVIQDFIKKNKNNNARSEGVFKARMWQASSGNRCVVPAAYFIEWQGKPGSKWKLKIYPKDGRTFSFAGFYDEWGDKEKPDELIKSCTILTCSPSDWMKQYHHREPVIIPKGLEEMWLDPATPKAELYDAILKPSSEKLEAQPLIKA